MSGIESRRRFRFEMPGDVFYTVRGEPAEGMLADVSTGGARIERATTVPSRGSKLLLELHLPDCQAPIEVELEVLRASADGFAGRFVDVPPRLVLRLSSGVQRAVRARWAEVGKRG